MAGPTKRKSRASVERGVIDYIQRPTADAGTGVILMGPYLIKGTKVTIDGKLRYSQWTKDDETRHELSVIVDQLEFSGGKREQSDVTATSYKPSHAAPEPEIDLYDEDIAF